MATEVKAPSTSGNAACNIGTFKGGPPPMQGGAIPAVVGPPGGPNVVKTGNAKR